MFILILIPLVFGIANAEELNKFKEDQDNGATWHYVGKQDADKLNAKSIDINGKIYFKLRKDK
jgi:hypothetical protein|tara:strand:- start:13 stop:201 length:189 start_codon:yes stop_codon:yes gene_type:complete